MLNPYYYDDYAPKFNCCEEQEQALKSLDRLTKYYA